MPQQQQQQMIVSRDFFCFFFYLSLFVYLIVSLFLSLSLFRGNNVTCWNHFCSLSTDQEDSHRNKKTTCLLSGRFFLSFFVAAEAFIRCPRSPPGTAAASCWPPAWGRSTDASCCCPATSGRPRWTGAWPGPPSADAADWPACRPGEDKKTLG